MSTGTGLQFTMTERGFRRAVFNDFYGNTNSIQESSIATDACIWLGCERTMNDESSHRMHLTRSMAAMLLPGMCNFVLFGKLMDQQPEGSPLPDSYTPYSDVYQVVMDEFARWQGDEAAEPTDAFEAEMQNAIRLGAIGALANIVARISFGNRAPPQEGSSLFLLCTSGDSRPDVVGRIGDGGSDRRELDKEGPTGAVGD